MSQSKTTEAIHPLGEGDFSFATPGGRVRLSVTKDALTPFGGLVPWAAYTKHIGIIDTLAADCRCSGPAQTRPRSTMCSNRSC